VTDDRSRRQLRLLALRYHQQGAHLEVTPLSSAVCERSLSPLEQRFGAFMDAVSPRHRPPDGQLILDSAPAQAAFARVA
jgi:hypothetical protein